MAAIEIALTEQGSLHLSAEVAARFFPHDLLAVLPMAAELWLLPTRGPAAGGLILKRRNAAGDRSVLIWHLLPHGVQAGPRPAIWDDARGALRVPLGARA